MPRVTSRTAISCIPVAAGSVAAAAVITDFSRKSRRLHRGGAPHALHRRLDTPSQRNLPPPVKAGDCWRLAVYAYHNRHYTVTVNVTL